MEPKMDEKPKKRPWFQFHLSTAVVLMFVASGLLWLNLRDPVLTSKNAYGGFFMWDRGWPLAYGRVRSDDYFVTEYLDALFFPGLFADSIVGLGVLLAVAVACEWPIRRREAKAPVKENAQGP